MKAMIARSASTSTPASGSAGTNECLGGDDNAIAARQRLVVEEGRDQRALGAREVRTPGVSRLPDDIEGHIRRARNSGREAWNVDDAVVLGNKNQCGVA